MKKKRLRKIDGKFFKKTSFKMELSYNQNFKDFLNLFSFKNAFSERVLHRTFSPISSTTHCICVSHSAPTKSGESSRSRLYLFSIFNISRLRYNYFSIYFYFHRSKSEIITEFRLLSAQNIFQTKFDFYLSILTSKSR